MSTSLGSGAVHARKTVQVSVIFERTLPSSEVAPVEANCRDARHLEGGVRRGEFEASLHYVSIFCEATGVVRKRRKPQQVPIPRSMSDFALTAAIVRQPDAPFHVPEIRKFEQTFSNSNAAPVRYLRH